MQGRGSLLLNILKSERERLHPALNERIVGGRGGGRSFKISNYISLMHLEPTFCMCKNEKGKTALVM